MKLNKQQKEAVNYDGSHLLIIAGAGTGKTSVITQRITNLIQSEKASPNEILALTFTDKAANEMTERVDLALPHIYANIDISTFHSFGDKLLKENSLISGYDHTCILMDDASKLLFCKENLLDYALQNCIYIDFERLDHIRKFLSFADRVRDEFYSPDELISIIEEKMNKAEDDAVFQLFQIHMDFAKLYKEYQLLKKKYGMMDFGDQVFSALKLINESPFIKKELRTGYKYILVDEFQDTNFVQYQLVKTIAGEEGMSLTVVCDDDQSIYKWRGAAISNIVRFQEDYPNAKTLVLQENYRSYQDILDASHKLIQFNDPFRLESRNNISKQLKSNTSPKDKVKSIRYEQFDKLSDEAEFVAEYIEKSISRKKYKNYSDFAILVRKNAHADEFLSALRSKGIPYKFSGNKGLYKQEEISFLLSFLKALAQPNANVAYYKLCTSEVYGIKDIDLVTLNAYARQNNRWLSTVYRQLVDGQLSGMPEDILDPTLKQKLKVFIDDMNKYTEMIKSHLPGQILYEYLQDKEILKKLAKEETLESEVKILNIAKFFNIINNYEKTTRSVNLPLFIEYLFDIIDLGDDPPVAEPDDWADVVNVLTVHKAKGLEFPVVFIVFASDKQFPTSHKSDKYSLPEELMKDYQVMEDELKEVKVEHTQEERRLFYVAMTRAKEKLILTSSFDIGLKHKLKPSRFIAEALDILPDKGIKVEKSSLEEIRSNQTPPPTKYKPKRSTKKDFIYISSTGFSTYTSCPLKYKFKYINKIPIAYSYVVNYGTIIHQIAADFIKAKMNKQNLTLEQLYQMLDERWEKLVFETDVQEEEKYKQAKEAIKYIFDCDEKAKTIPTAVEKEFNIKLDNNIKISGRWDRIDKKDEEEVIIDYKTSKVDNKKKADTKVRDNPQMRIYALAYKYINKTIPSKVQMRFLLSQITGEYSFSEKQLDNMENKIKKAAMDIRDEKFEPTPGFMACKYCDYKPLCPDAM